MKLNVASRKLDLILILLWPIVASLISFLIKTNAFGSIIIFEAIPAIYLSIRAPQYIRKSLIFSTLFIPVIIIIDYVAHLNGQWLIPDSVLPYRLFGLVTLEVIFWTYCLAYLTIIFYEYFFERHLEKSLWHRRLKYLFAATIICFAIFLFYLIFLPKSLIIDYFYFKMGLVLILIPLILGLFRYSKLAAKIFKTGAYFFYLTFLYEVSALKLGWWDFPSDKFVGLLYVFGVRFPFEEFFFWLMLCAMAVLVYYEYFDDDGK